MGFKKIRLFVFTIFLSVVFAPLVLASSPPCLNPEEEIPLGSCNFVPSHHSCDAGGGGGAPSAVSNSVTGGSAAANFTNVVNKKLACCMNTHNLGDTLTKFDCADNSASSTSDFNTLWTGADIPAVGEQLYAIILTNGAGKPVTGFFTLTGARCSEFSEFGATSAIQGKKLNPLILAGQQDKVTGTGGIEDSGAPIPIPSVGAYGTMRNLIAKGIPTTNADMIRCPILVRAAIITTCPSDTLDPQMHVSIPFRPDVGLPTLPPTQCSAAQKIQVHVRMEQIYEIAGSPKMKTVDSIQDLSTHSVSIDDILAQKNGGTCEFGSQPMGNICVYPSP